MFSGNFKKQTQYFPLVLNKLINEIFPFFILRHSFLENLYKLVRFSSELPKIHKLTQKLHQTLFYVALENLHSRRS